MFFYCGQELTLILSINVEEKVASLHPPFQGVPYLHYVHYVRLVKESDNMY